MIDSYRPSIRGRRYVVSSLHYLASMAGARILDQGGNAADAGVAMGLCINVLEPELTHFGGVAPIIYCPGSGGPVETISGVGRWPRAASLEYFQELYQGDLPFGVLRTVTPAAPDAWLTALSRFGTMTFEQVVQPALSLAECGRPVDPRFHRAISNEIVWPSTAEIYNPNGRIPEVDELFLQEDLAKTFKRMIEAERGAEGGRTDGIRAARDLIYKGEIAAEIARFHQDQGSLLTSEDLASFSVGVEQPEHINYKGYDVYSCGPWCQGPTFLMTLRLLEGFDLKTAGHNSAGYLHTIVESLKLAFADRHAYIGDPEFVRVPMAGLLNEGYAVTRRQTIDDRVAAPGLPPPGNPWQFDPQENETHGECDGAPQHDSRPGDGVATEMDTSYLCVVDADGNAFSATPSDGFGSSPVVPGLGFPISARGSQTWLAENHPSGLRPWKRPRLTPNPALVLKDGKPYMTLGCPGGDAQVQGMLQVFLNIVEFGMEPQQAIEAPRVVTLSAPDSFWPHLSRPGEVMVETRISEEVRAKLASRGHIIREDGEWSNGVSRVCAIIVEPTTGVRVGGADPRSTSYAIGW